MLQKSEFWGAVLLVIGLIMIIGRLTVVDYDLRHFIGSLWPLFLIIIGVALIASHKRSSTLFGDVKIDQASREVYDSIRELNRIFGDISIRGDNMEIGSRSFSTVFGDIEMDLVKATAREGINSLYVSAVFGDITLALPQNIEVLSYCSSAFGDLYNLGAAKSGITSNLTRRTEGYEKAATTLHITARTTFGDIKIYRA